MCGCSVYYFTTTFLPLTRQIPQGSSSSDVADMLTPCILYMPLEMSMALSSSMSSMPVGSPPFSPRTKPAYTCLRQLLMSQIPTGSPPRHPLFAGASVVHHWQIPIASDGSRFFMVYSIFFIICIIETLFKIFDIIIYQIYKYIYYLCSRKSIKKIQL